MDEDDDLEFEPITIRDRIRLWLSGSRAWRLVKRMAHRSVCWRPSLHIGPGEIVERCRDDYCQIVVDGGELHAASIRHCCELTIKGDAKVWFTGIADRATIG